MSNVYRIHVLPAQRGDSLWIEYGAEAAPNHILIDGGITATDRDHLRKRVECRRRSKFDPPCRSNIDPGMEADGVMVGCGQV